MRKLWLVVSLILLSSIASAGKVNERPVVIDLDQSRAAGDQLTARTADNDIELIGCGIKVYDDGVNPVWSFGFCQARDSADRSIQCFTGNADLLEAIKGASAYAWISFSWREDPDFGFECSSIQFSTNSFYLPDPNLKPKEK